MGNEPLFISPEHGWRECPGGLVTEVNLERAEGKCPSCEFTFSTFTDEPVLPPHWVSHGGQVVIFAPKKASDG